MSSYEIQEYLEYYALYPFGERRQDYNAGLICSTLKNIYLSKNSTPSTPLDYMPYLAQEKRFAEDMKPSRVKAAEIKAKIASMFTVIKKNAKR